MKDRPATDPSIKGKLFPLSELEDFEVDDKNPDVRGWDVSGGDGKKLGRVEELIVDPSLLKVRYLLVEILDEVSLLEGSHNILVPVGAATLMEDHDVVLVNNLTSTNINSYPHYDTSGTSAILQYERNLRSFYDFGEGEIYDQEYFDDRKFYGSRRRD